MSEKIGLCLTGGGAKGAYQIGAIQALEELGIYQKVDVFSGTSIGAANASVLASSSIMQVKDIWFNIPENAIVVEKPLVNRIKEDGFKTFDNGIYTMNEFQNVMINKINTDILKDKRVYVTISEVGEEQSGLLNILPYTYKHYIKNESKVHYIPLHTLDHETCLDLVTASCSIPVAFPAIVKDNKKYYDGGLYDNMPVVPLIEEGCTEIYIIDISTINQPNNLRKKYPNIIFHILKSKKSLGKVLDFTVDHAKRLYDLGYNDTMIYFGEQ